MTNPISTRVRGILYVISIIVGILATVVPPVVAALGVGDQWALVVTSGVGAITTITSTLARANLTEPGVVSGAVVGTPVDSVLPVATS
ncbi:hypothetical protein GCM10009785_01730 [Brooklawnia cerclae]|uniref:Low affinity Fe/Cu permease n=1 Tax=Brooklawnia cerclae TaxID=349934 RepID=A0ABX0SCW5_9ACTN|nr:hypothetical protein [Brooklawnia cerclae]NIH56233.1 low affinity Fe/Cu permease [Brooklawnia cerclae]